MADVKKDDLPEPSLPAAADPPWSPTSASRSRPVIPVRVLSAVTLAATPAAPLDGRLPSGRPNTFSLQGDANGDLAAMHERLRNLVEQLAGSTPEFTAVDLDKDAGLLGLSSSVSRAMSARIEHCGRLLDLVEEHLR